MFFCAASLQRQIKGGRGDIQGRLLTMSALLSQIVVKTSGPQTFFFLVTKDPQIDIHIMTSHLKM